MPHSERTNPGEQDVSRPLPGPGAHSSARTAYILAHAPTLSIGKRVLNRQVSTTRKFDKGAPSHGS